MTFLAPFSMAFKKQEFLIAIKYEPALLLRRKTHRLAFSCLRLCVNVVSSGRILQVKRMCEEGRSIAESKLDWLTCLYA